MPARLSQINVSIKTRRCSETNIFYSLSLSLSLTLVPPPTFILSMCIPLSSTHSLLHLSISNIHTTPCTSLSLSLSHTHTHTHIPKHLTILFTHYLVPTLASSLSLFHLIAWCRSHLTKANRRCRSNFYRVVNEIPLFTWQVSYTVTSLIWSRVISFPQTWLLFYFSRYTLEAAYNCNR